MNTIHISHQRFEFIKGQGYTYRQSEWLIGDGGGAEEIEVTGSCVYHVLSDEYGFCQICRDSFDSVDANSPAELETIKHCLALRRDAVPALRNMRQEMLAHYKELCLRAA